jgi:hypothetical protein
MENLTQHAMTRGMAEDSRTWTVDDTSFVMDSAFLLVTSKYHPNPFLILRSYCENPDCSCEEVTFRFLEAGDPPRFSKEPVKFDLKMNVPEWKVTGKAPVPETLKPLVEGFITNIGEEAKDTFRDELKSAKEHGARAARFTIPVDDVLDGMMVPYSQVFFDGGSIFDGGKEASFSFTHEGASYFIDDQYCIDPHCDCAKTRLTFLLDDDASKTIRDAFDVVMELKGRVVEIKTYHSFSDKKARQIVTAWKAQERNIFGVLEERYYEIKSIGARILKDSQDLFDGTFTEDSSPIWDLATNQSGFSSDAVDNKRVSIAKAASVQKTAPVVKVGRNAPCPCGSGKKYKKCCGASR